MECDKPEAILWPREKVLVSNWRVNSGAKNWEPQASLHVQAQEWRCVEKKTDELIYSTWKRENFIIAPSKVQEDHTHFHTLLKKKNFYTPKQIKCNIKYQKDKEWRRPKRSDGK